MSATGSDGATRGGGTMLEVRDLVKHFPVSSGLWRRSRQVVHAVCGVSFDIARGETLGLVGESGSGKSTLARVMPRLLPADAGSIRFDGEELLTSRAARMRELRRRMQIVFQDPFSSLNPRMTAHAIIAEPLRIYGLYRDDGAGRVRSLLDVVGLKPEHAERYPHEFSGGERQRIGIARALALDPDLLVLDEPLSALDVSIQAGIINLLEDLQQRLGLAYLLIGHDLSVVRCISHRVAVMYLGKIVEIGSRDEIYNHPAHPYTQALLSAVPVPDPVVQRRRKRIILAGDVPSPVHPPSGCRFRSRCWSAQDVCALMEPALVNRATAHPVACHFADEVTVI